MALSARAMTSTTSIAVTGILMTMRTSRCPAAGMLKSVTLPTGGGFDYLYQFYDFPDEPSNDCNQVPPSSGCLRNIMYVTRTLGVAERTMRDDVTGQLAGKPRTWRYYQNRVWDLDDGCRPWREKSMTIFNPDGAASTYHYSAWVDGRNDTPYDDDQGGGTGEDWALWERGMPFTRLDYVLGLDPDVTHEPLYLSKDLWDCPRRVRSRNVSRCRQWRGIQRDSGEHRLPSGAGGLRPLPARLGEHLWLGP